MDEENSDINKMLVLGETSFRNRNRQFGIKADDRRRHCYIIGKTGVGKTTLIENMVIQDIQNGRGVALVDPHGDPAENVINYIPNNRVNDIVNFDPSDTEFPVAFNVLETVDPSSPGFDQEKSLVSSGLIGVFKKIWADSWGPRLEYILRNTILALLDSPGNTLLGIPRIYVDKKFRKEIVDNIKDPVVRSFWVDEFANYNEKFRSEAIAPIQNKVGQFLSSSIIRNIVGQPKSTIDLQDIMDNRRILIMNLSKGKIGEDNASLLGAMMITKIQLTAMARARIPEADRKDFYLYVDEFQNFATESFATILSEARKYRLNLIIAHQYITQMAEEVRDAVFGNLGTIMSFRVGAFDAEFMEPEFLPTFEQTDLVNLPNYNAYIRLMIDGITSKPFSMRCLRPSGVRYDNREKVLRVSRERFGRPKAVVEEKISR
jgi:type IV secretory pathway TraG/TraD family ATPase VirD4